MPLPKPVITVYEHELLSVGEQRNGLTFTAKHLDQLAIRQAHFPAALYRLEYKAVRFGSVVGVIQLPKLLIEILPKISSLADPRQLRIAWTQILHTSGYLPHLGNPDPQLLTQPGALAEVLQRSFLEEVHLLIRQGLVKQYHTTEGQRPYLRGKLMLSQQIRHNLIRKDRFYVRTQTHLPDHPYNQRLKQALRIVEASGNSKLPTTQLLVSFRQVATLPLNQSWNSIPTFNRLTEPYRGALALAELICKGYLGGTFIGQDFGFSLLFDMPRVFEFLVHRYLRNLSQTQSWQLKYQPDRIFWHTKTLRPDFIIDLPGAGRVVIDTKWKILTRPEPNDEDLRQIFVYTQLFKAQRGILLYPKVHELKPTSQNFDRSATQTSRCEIQFLPLLENPQEHLLTILQNNS